MFGHDGAKTVHEEMEEVSRPCRTSEKSNMKTILLCVATLLCTRSFGTVHTAPRQKGGYDRMEREKFTFLDFLA